MNKNNPATLEDYNKLVKKVLYKQDKKKPVEQYFEAKAKMYYLYERVVGRKITPETPSTELLWFKWCLEQGVDPELKLKD